ncbi:MAG TPA: mevalonate kinase [Candidatus Acidoferrales bacterium]|nr:mevalonate kinase [Candidatus Acidoferrales bacterium]
MKKQNSITVSAPGKIHLMGEHAVVYGKPALLAAINMRCSVQLISSDSDTITITSENLNKKMTYSPNEIIALTKEAEKKWDAFQKNNDSSLLTLHSVDLPAIAIGETIAFLQKRLPSEFDLIINSAIPIGSGLGSSAALSVAIVAAVMQFVTKKIDKETVNTIAFRIEQRIHGNPSGGDNTICCYGGIGLFQNKSFTKKLLQSKANFLLIDSGRPTETTGEMVSLVGRLQKENRSMFAQFLSDQEQVTRDLVSVLQNSNEENLMDLIKRGERNLEKIGVVSDSAKSLIALIEKEGGAAKICGAGGRKKGSGMLLVYHPEKEKLKKSLLLNKNPLYDIMLGSEGVMLN